MASVPWIMNVADVDLQLYWWLPIWSPG